MLPPARSFKDYAVAWICALPLEMAAAKLMLDVTYSPLPQPPTDHNTYVLGRVGDHAVVITCLPYGVYGTTSASTVVAEMRSTFPCLRFGLMVGIGGGVPSRQSDIRLGDVVVSKPSATSGGVIQYDYGKTVRGGRIERTGSLNKPHPALLTAMAHIESNRLLGKETITEIIHNTLQADDEVRKRFGRPETDWLFVGTYDHIGGDSDCLACDRSQLLPREARAAEGPGIHYGLIASGNQVMKDGHTRDRIAAGEGIICFDMEAAGLMDQLPCLVIRGICDYCDSHKNKHWQGYAALTAAAYARDLLSVVPNKASMDGEEARKPIWMVPFPRNPHFAGREDQMTRLMDLISTSNGPMKIALTALGGAGKTQLALELVYKMRDKDPNWSVFWISSVSLESVEQAYMNIAQHLQLPNVSPADVKMRVKSYLSHERAGKWLLVCDNADDMDMWAPRNRMTTSLSAFLPQSNQGRVLFTTRNRKLAQQLASYHIISLPEIDERTAKEILKRSLLRPELCHETTVTTTLLKELYFLPLAITQAAAYINANEIDLASYVELLQGQEHDIIELLSEHFEDEGRYMDSQNPVATTWLVSFDQIQRSDSLAADYLSFMACVDPRNIPRSLIPGAPSKKKKIDALGLLNAYSFTTSQNDGSLSIHRLVHFATRSWLRNNNSLHTSARRAADRFEEVFPNADHRNRSLWREYLPHALFLMQKHSFSDVKGDHVNLIANIGGCLYGDGRYNEAEAFFHDALTIRQEKLGAKHLDTLISMSDIALTYRNLGRYKEAEPLQSQVMETRKTVLGIEHPMTLTSMANLAITYRDLGRSKEAERLEVFYVMEAQKHIVLGTEHPGTCISMGKLAFTYRYLGRLKEAERLEIQVMKARKILLGTEHPATLTSMGNLAFTYRYLGRLKEAERLEMQVMKARKILLGTEHPETITSMYNLAMTYVTQSRLKEAEQLKVQVVERSKTVLGIEHPDTLKAMHSLAITLQDAGKHQDAISLMKDCVQFRKKYLRPDHPHTKSSMKALRRWQAREWWMRPYGTMIRYGAITAVYVSIPPVLPLVVLIKLPILISSIMFWSYFRHSAVLRNLLSLISFSMAWPYFSQSAVFMKYSLLISFYVLVLFLIQRQRRWSLTILMDIIH